MVAPDNRHVPYNPQSFPVLWGSTDDDLHLEKFTRSLAPFSRRHALPMGLCTENPHTQRASLRASNSPVGRRGLPQKPRTTQCPCLVRVECGFYSLSWLARSVALENPVQNSECRSSSCRNRASIQRPKDSRSAKRSRVFGSISTLSPSFVG